MVSLDFSVGREQQGFRPVLVVSPADFNAATRLPVVLPITNGRRVCAPLAPEEGAARGSGPAAKGGELDRTCARRPWDVAGRDGGTGALIEQWNVVFWRVVLWVGAMLQLLAGSLTIRAALRIIPTTSRMGIAGKSAGGTQLKDAHALCSTRR